MDPNKVTSDPIKEILLNKYPHVRLIMKLGSSGSAYISKLKEIKMKAVTELNPSILKEYKIIDTTGAGDCFTAAFSVRYIEIFSWIFLVLFI